MVSGLLRRISDRYIVTAFPVSPETHIDKCRYVVIDTELTGLDFKRDSIISIGAVKMNGNRILLGDYFYRIIEPRTPLKKDSVIIHTITPSEAASCPSIEKLLPEFINFCKDSILVGHFIFIDLNFLNKELKEASLPGIRNPVLDTAKIYNCIKSHDLDSFRRLETGSEERDLYSIAKKYDIEIKGAHNALTDAFITAQLFQRFLSLLPERGVKTLRDLLKIGKP